MACIRHSYPKGATPPRKCRNCDHVDVLGASGHELLPPTAATEPAVPWSTMPALGGLPEHSALGASSAERWMNCSGSVALTHAIKTGEGFIDDDPDYRRDGVSAHALAAWCLEHGADCYEAPLDQFPELTADMMTAVQVYIDYARSLPGDRYVETRVHRPEFHELFYGTLDFAAIMRTVDHARFLDYKHGEGVLVEVRRNPQLMYYVYGFIGEDKTEYPDAMAVELGVVQPRAQHPDGPIRIWTTTAGEIRQWAHDVLRPAMDRTMNDRFLSVGEWCRFCPAKIVCPAMTSLADELTFHRETPLQAMPREMLGELYGKSKFLRMMFKALDDEVARRVLAGDVVPGAKAVKKITDRVFKDGAPVADTFGDAAWVPAKLKTPPGIEALPGGKDFVAEWAFSPDGGVTVAPESDRRAAVSVSPEAKYGDPQELLEIRHGYA